MESRPDSPIHQQIERLLRGGQLQDARQLAYSWLHSWMRSRPSNSTPAQLRNQLLWKCLADVVEHTHDDYLAERFWQYLDNFTPPAPDCQAIPLLGIPILNRLDLLYQLLDSLDYPVQQLAIVDNSPARGPHSTLGPELEQLRHNGHPHIRAIELARPFRNLGVAESWNLILTSFPESSWAVLANNDIQFAPGVLAAAAAQINPTHPQFLPLLPDPQNFSAFLITAKTWDQIGLFDTGFYPAYCEDLDYRDRLRADSNVQWLENSTLETAMAARNLQHSATIASDPELAERNRSSFQLNRLWYFSQRRLRGNHRGHWVRRWLGSWDN